MTTRSDASATPRSQPGKGEALPTFTLPDTAGTQRRLWDFKQRRPVVLFIPHAPTCAGCLAWLTVLRANHARLDELSAAVLIIVQCSNEAARAFQSSLDLPYVVLVDADGAVASHYASPGAAALFLGDRYLHCLGSWRDAGGHALPAPDEAVGILAFAEQEDCGCGLPAWPEELM